MNDQPQRSYPDVPPARVSSEPGHPDFHPSNHRIGVLVDGVRDLKCCWYDAQRNLFRRLGDHKAVPREAGRVDVYWLREESRQERRARERWDAKHRGKVETAPDREPPPFRAACDVPPMEGASKEPPADQAPPITGLQEVDQLGVRPADSRRGKSIGLIGAAAALSLLGGGYG